MIVRKDDSLTMTVINNDSKNSLVDNRGINHGSKYEHLAKAWLTKVYNVGLMMMMDDDDGPSTNLYSHYTVIVHFD